MPPVRRLTAILAADVAGYSRLMGEDEEGTHERLRAHLRELVNPKIGEHRGRVVKNTGDGFLAEFQSVVDAVRCAVEIQGGMAERNGSVPPDKWIDFRVGINLGDVIAEGDDIYGDGVNVAARLEGLAEPGGVLISNTVHDHVRDRLPFAFEDLGDHQVKNMARPVRVYRVRDRAAPIEPPLLGPPPPLPLPDKPSVAVLAFTNMSPDPEQEFFGDGIAEDVITALSRYPSLFVIARNSSFTYKGRAVDVKQIGRDLGVRYVLEGSLRKAGNRIRITAQLVEAETGNHVWAERYDRDLINIFAVQDEITDAVTIAIAPAIADAERHRAARRPPDGHDTWSAYQRGLWHLSKATPEDNRAAQKCFGESIVLDANFSGGHSGLALAQMQESGLFATRPVAEARISIKALALRAVTSDEGDAEAHACLSWALNFDGDYDGALAEARRALTISPNLASAHRALGTTLIFSGEPRQGLVSLQTSIRLDPRDPLLPWHLNRMAIAHYFLREYEAAIDTARRVIRLYPDFPLIYRWLAAALGQAGRLDEARDALNKAIAVSSGSFDMYVRARVPWHRAEDYKHMLEGLRKAGWREE